MRVAFYAPMKPPDHSVPSGDRRMAALLIEALERAGHQVELACRLRSRDPRGDPARQARLRCLGQALGQGLAARYRRRSPEARPNVWFTYHLYYKAPDWIGPAVSGALGIPYVVAEASVADKRAGGPWDAGHRATLAALDRAARVIALNSSDLEALPDRTKTCLLKPFLDPRPFAAAMAWRGRHRTALAERLGLEADNTWLLTVAMMRPGDKLTSYRVLAEALARVRRQDWRLIVAGGGPARAEVEAAFARFRSRQVCFIGETSGGEMPPLMAACDLFVWPAINEAYGMALLEAQAGGLAAVAGRSGGVLDIVQDGVTGILTEPGDPAALAAAVERLIGDPAARGCMAAAALQKVAAHHGLDAAAGRLDAVLRAAAAPP